MTRKLIPLLATVALILLAFKTGYENPKEIVFNAVLSIDSSGAELDALMRFIAARHQHGADDDGLPPLLLAQKLLDGSLVGTCGTVADAAALLINDAGFQARRVALIARDELNGCDDGHQALEVWHPFYQQWVFVDFDTNRLYPQTVEEFTGVRAAWVPLADDPLFAPSWTLACASPITSSIDAWYDRVAGISLISGGDGLMYYDAHHPLAARAATYARGYYVAADGWHEQFYGGE